MNLCMWHDKFICVTWLIIFVNMLGIWRWGFKMAWTNVTWLIHIRVVTHLCMRRESFIYVTWLIQIREHARHVEASALVSLQIWMIHDTHEKITMESCHLVIFTNILKACGGDCSGKFICVTWLILQNVSSCKNSVLPHYIRVTRFIPDLFTCETWLMPDWFICETWLISDLFICLIWIVSDDPALWIQSCRIIYVRHESFQTCSYVRHDSFLTYLLHVWHDWFLAYGGDRFAKCRRLHEFRCVTWLIPDVSMCATWLIHIHAHARHVYVQSVSGCMNSDVWHDSFLTCLYVWPDSYHEYESCHTYK